MGILTTLQAIQIGIDSIRQRNDIPQKTKENAIHLLQGIEKADWYREWDKEKVIKVLTEYKERTGITPSTNTLKEYGMPKGVTIQSLFHISPSLFLKRLFPDNRTMRYANLEVSNPFGFENQEDWLNCFIEQFNKHKTEIDNSKRYNLVRDNNTPTWGTIAKHCGLTTWKELMKKAGVEYQEKKIQTATNIHIVNFTSPLVTKLEAINQRRAELNAELLDILSIRK